MKILSVSNIKGGVAKTTTAATLAAGLHKRGYKILLIDSDPQENLTMCFMQEPSENSPSLYDVYSQKSQINDIKLTLNDGFDLVPGDFSLCSADMEFLGKIGSLRILSKALDNIKSQYDYIIIDTPPNLGCLSLNAFMASDYIITPMSADTFSLKAIRLLKETIDNVSEEVGKKIPVAGILLTKYTGRTNISKLLESSVQRAAELLQTTVFQSRIRQATVVQECQLVHMNLFDYAPKAPVTADYDSFINELLERIGD